MTLEPHRSRKATQCLQRAETFLEERSLEEASQAFVDAERAGADVERCSAGRWMVAMLEGDFERAWLESDATRHRGVLDPHQFWTGENLRDKTVIVRCLHGLGDAIHFLRYVPHLRRLAYRVIVEVPPGLLTTATMIAGIDEVITWGETAPTAPPTWDVQVEVMELPYIFRTIQSDLPLLAEYLHVPSASIREVHKKMGGSSRVKVGVVWAAGEWNPGRSLPPDLLSYLLENNTVELWNLQGAGARSAVSKLLPKGSLREVAECEDGIHNLAAVVANLDLVITVDTLAAHLAGAIGKPVWVLLQGAADWRWMVNRSDSPWYPTMHLFRQKTAGDWKGVMADVRAMLKDFVADRRQSKHVVQV